MAEKLVANCATGAVTTQSLTAAEERVVAAAQQFSAQHAAGREAALAQRQADLAALRAYAAEPGAHPAWAAIARLLGAL